MVFQHCLFIIQKFKIFIIQKFKIIICILESNLSLYSLYYAKAYNELAVPFSVTLRLRKHCLSKKCRNGGKLLTTLCPIWPSRDLNLTPPAPETNKLPLDQLAGNFLELDEKFFWNVAKYTKF